MSIDTIDGRKVHYPADPKHFVFDSEVANLFDDMAVRSIPMYNEVHRMHVSMLRDKFRQGAIVVDVGSSTGKLFSTIEAEMGRTVAELDLECHAIDSSDAMMGKLHGRFPSAKCTVASLPDVPNLESPADVMFCLYTVQFVPIEHRSRVMSWFSCNLKPDGILVLGQKETVRSHTLAPLYSEEYYKFRRGNGYTQDEIDAKTLALKSSMWPVSDTTHESEATAAGFRLYPSSRWLEFSTYILQRKM